MATIVVFVVLLLWLVVCNAELFSWHDPKDAEFEIVFVHGLNGHYEDTWKSGNEIWPKAWLPQNFPKARIFSFSYDNKMSYWQQGNKLDLSGKAQQFCNALKLDDVCLHRSCFLVGHSMGGLVIKNAVVEAFSLSQIQNYDQSWYKNFLANIAGVVFMGTPHVGAQLSVYLDALMSLLGLNPTTSMMELQPLSFALASLSLKFSEFAKTSLSFCETKPVSPLTVLVVEIASCQLNPNPAELPDEDHISISKPASKESHVYKTLIKFMKRVVPSPSPVCEDPDLLSFWSFDEPQLWTTRLNWGRHGQHQCADLISRSGWLFDTSNTPAMVSKVFEPFPEDCCSCKVEFAFYGCSIPPDANVVRKPLSLNFTMQISTNNGNEWQDLFFDSFHDQQGRYIKREVSLSTVPFRLRLYLTRDRKTFHTQFYHGFIGDTSIKLVCKKEKTEL